MITLKKLSFYEKFGINKERFIKKSILHHCRYTRNDWVKITQLINNLIIIRTKHASDEFRNAVIASMHKICDDELTVQKLYTLSSEFAG